jgi:hypothetical protein
MSGRDRSSAVILGFAWLWLAGHQAFAQKVYKWTDPDGRVHFSNVGPAGESAPEEPAPAVSQPAEAQAGEAGGAEAQAVAAEGTGAYSGLSEDEFSAKASTTRMRLKRELAQAKQQSQEASDKVAAIEKELNQPPQMGIEVLQKTYGPRPQEGSDLESLRKQKEQADQRIKEIRKEYTELHDEAVKRFGHQPSWWLPIE